MIHMYPEQRGMHLPPVVKAVIDELERNNNRLEMGFAGNLYSFCIRDYSTGLYWSFFGRLEKNVLSVFLDDEDTEIIETFTDENINLTRVFAKDFEKWHPEFDIKEINSCNAPDKI